MVIAAAPPDPVGLSLRLILPLAAIAPVSKLAVWSLLLGYIDPRTAFLSGLVSYALNLAAVYLLVFIAARLAPYFEGEARPAEALTLVAWAATASWIGAIFHVVPVLGVLSVLASLYSLYLLFCGAPTLLAVPPQRALTYTAAVGLAALGLFVLISAGIAAVFGIAALGMA